MFSRKFLVLAILPAALIFLAFLVYPLMQVLYLSTTNFRLTRPADANFVGAEQFIRVFTDIRFLEALFRTLYFAALSVVLSVVIGFFVAYLLQRDDMKGSGVFRAIILLPMLVTPLVAGSVFRYMLDFENGIINYMITQLGFNRVAFLSSTEWAIHSAVFVDVWQWFPFAAIVFIAGLQGIPKETLEAASLDGAGFWRTLLFIKLPQIRSVTAVIVLIRFMDAFREFDKVYIMTMGGPGSSSETLSIYVWRQAFQYYNTGFSAASGIVMIFVVSILSTLFVKSSKVLREG